MSSTGSEPRGRSPAAGERRLYSAISEIPGEASASLNGRPSRRPEIARSSSASDTCSWRRSICARTERIISSSVLNGLLLSELAGLRDEALQRGEGGPRVDRLLGEAHTLLETRGAVRHEHRRAGVQHHEGAPCTRLAAEHRARDLGVS